MNTSYELSKNKKRPISSRVDDNYRDRMNEYDSFQIENTNRLNNSPRSNQSNRNYQHNNKNNKSRNNNNRNNTSLYSHSVTENAYETKMIRKIDKIW